MKPNQIKKKLINEFFDYICQKFNSEKILLLNLCIPKALDGIKYKKKRIVENIDELNNNVDYYDLIIGEIPIGSVHREKVYNFKEISLELIWYILNSLSENGIAYFVVFSPILFSNRWSLLLEESKKMGFYFNSAFYYPDRIYSETSVKSVIASFSKKKHEKLFIGEISKDNYVQLLNNHFNNNPTNLLLTGKLVERDHFLSFNRFQVQEQIDALITQYSEYKKTPFSKVLKTIKLTNIKTQENSPNQIFIDSYGIEPPELKIVRESKKQKYRYFQIELNIEFVTNEYLVIFFKSKLGKLVLESLRRDSLIGIKKEVLLESEIPIPPKHEQWRIIHTANKINELNTIINELKNEISINPKNTDEIIEKIEKIKGPLQKITESDKIKYLVSKGENKEIEFKQVFMTDLKTGKPNKNVKKKIAKTIVAFLNTCGGTLLVGVSDDRKIIGIDSEITDSDDKYLLRFSNYISAVIHPSIRSSQYVSWAIFKVDGKKVFKIECKKATEPYFFENDFFIRENPQSIKLEKDEASEYIKKNFSKNI